MDTSRTERYTHKNVVVVVVVIVIVMKALQICGHRENAVRARLKCRALYYINLYSNCNIFIFILQHFNFIFILNFKHIYINAVTLNTVFLS